MFSLIKASVEMSPNKKEKAVGAHDESQQFPIHDLMLNQQPAHRCAPDLQTLEILLILNAVFELVGVFRPAFQAECCRFDPGHPLSINLAKVSVYDLPARPSASPTLNPVRSCAPERKGLHDEQPISASVQETPTQHLLPIQREPSCQNQDPPVSA